MESDIDARLPFLLTLTAADRAQLIEGIEEFIISGDPAVREIWQPYIDKLRASLPPVIDNGNIFVFCDFVDPKTDRACVRGAGHNGAHALAQSPIGSRQIQEPVLLMEPS